MALLIDCSVLVPANVKLKSLRFLIERKIMATCFEWIALFSMWRYSIGELRGGSLASCAHRAREGFIGLTTP